MTQASSACVLMNAGSTTQTPISASGSPRSVLLLGALRLAQLREVPLVIADIHHWQDLLFDTMATSEERGQLFPPPRTRAGEAPLESRDTGPRRACSRTSATSPVTAWQTATSALAYLSRPRYRTRTHCSSLRSTVVVDVKACALVHPKYLCKRGVAI